MEIRFLGVGNAFAPGGLAWNGVVVDRDILLDAPPTALPKLNQYGYQPEAIAAVVISHFHSDHFAGLPFLLLHYESVAPRTTPLTIVGPPGVEAELARLTEAMDTGVESDPPAFRRDFTEVADGFAMTLAGGRLEARRMQHAPTLEAFGYRYTRGDVTVAYSGDTTFCPALVELGTGADTLIVECASATEESPVHMNLRLVRELRDAVPATTRILLTHREPGLSAEGIANTFPAEEGILYRLRRVNGYDAG
jgi:ribonuclease BN (tRNA processing enzyme)